MLVNCNVCIPTFDGELADFPRWLRSVREIAAALEPFPGCLSSFVSADSEEYIESKAQHTTKASHSLSPTKDEEQSLQAEKMQSFFLRLVREALGPRVKLFLSDCGVDAASPSMFSLFTALRKRYGALSSENVVALFDALSSPSEDAKSIAELVRRHRSVHALLTASPALALSAQSKARFLREAVRRGGQRHRAILRDIDKSNQPSLSMDFETLALALRYLEKKYSQRDRGDRNAQRSRNTCNADFQKLFVSHCAEV